jgi:aspartyl-tRNA synthetase
VKRSHHCGALRPEHVGQTVCLMGWAQTTRDHGGLLFIDLRDREGLAQIVCDPQEAPEAHELAKQVRSEWVLAAEGEVRPRPEGMENPNLPTGMVEVRVKNLEVLNRAETPPFMITDEVGVEENLRLRYRYLDLRRARMQRNLGLRHELTRATREYLNGHGFWEIETPLLTKSTPEGARDFLVPARLDPGKFFALPQSPQLLKELLMVAGCERYYQMARCLRDEDLRADRQYEHTQIDLEMSFVDQEEVLDLVEGLMVEIMAVGGIEVSRPFTRLSYAEAMARFGCDKPDLRYGMELVDVSDVLRGTEFQVFQRALGGEGQVKGINAKGCAGYSRKELDDLSAYATRFGAGGVAPIAVTAEGIKSPIAKFLSESEQQGILTAMAADPGDLILLVADQPETVAMALDRLRQHLAERLEIIPRDAWEFLWVVDFPLFEWNSDEGRIDPKHHVFSSPRDEDLPLLDTDPLKVHGKLYDLVLNGVELGSGSIRIHRRELQEKVFGIIQLSPEEAQRRFGFLLDAFRYGAPPHAGIGIGFDRLVALIAGEESIREVIAFPKTAAGTDPMTAAPSAVDDEQLRELGLALRRPPKPAEESSP